MEIRNAQYKVRGMNKDLSYSAFDPKFSWHNHNVRLTARDSNDLLGVTNEKGNSQLSFNDVSPTKIIKYIYTALFDNYLLEQIPLVYTYSSSFDNFLVEETDGTWTPPVAYTYIATFNNYLLEQITI